MADEGKQTFLERVKGMADELGLEGEKREEYIENHLTKKGGFKKVINWEPDTGSAGDKGGTGRGWF